MIAISIQTLQTSRAFNDCDKYTNI